MKLSLVTAVLATLLLSGCVAPNQYHWGNYEQVIYLSYNAPDKASLEQQIAFLEEDIEKARSQDKPLPPGFRAHLGVLYFQNGQSDKALELFESEKELYPESTKLMNRFIEKLGQ